MSQDIDICEQHLQNISDNNLLPRETNHCSRESASMSGREFYPKCDEAMCGEDGSVMFYSRKVIAFNELSRASVLYFLMKELYGCSLWLVPFVIFFFILN